MLGLWMKFMPIHRLQGCRDSVACDGMLVSPVPGLTRQHSAGPADGFIACLYGTFPPAGRGIGTSLGLRNGLETGAAHDVLFSVGSSG